MAITPALCSWLLCSAALCLPAPSAAHGADLCSADAYHGAQVEEIVKYLKNSALYLKLGAQLPAGVLMVGPPGTGKTLLARAIAGEAKVPFFFAAGSEFMEMFVGVGASRVRNLFEQARTQRPCIIFIDEFDAIGTARESGNAAYGNEETANTINQLLTEMDGFEDNTVRIRGTPRKSSKIPHPHQNHHTRSRTPTFGLLRAGPGCARGDKPPCSARQGARPPRPLRPNPPPPASGP